VVNAVDCFLDLPNFAGYFVDLSCCLCLFVSDLPSCFVDLMAVLVGPLLSTDSVLLLQSGVRPVFLVRHAVIILFQF
jgi:hypothetical protein